VLVVSLHLAGQGAEVSRGCRKSSSSGVPSWDKSGAALLCEEDATVGGSPGCWTWQSPAEDAQREQQQRQEQEQEQEQEQQEQQQQQRHHQHQQQHQQQQHQQQQQQHLQHLQHQQAECASFQSALEAMENSSRENNDNNSNNNNSDNNNNNDNNNSSSNSSDNNTNNSRENSLGREPKRSEQQPVVTFLVSVPPPGGVAYIAAKSLQVVVFPPHQQAALAWELPLHSLLATKAGLHTSLQGRSPIWQAPVTAPEVSLVVSWLPAPRGVRALLKQKACDEPPPPRAEAQETASSGRGLSPRTWERRSPGLKVRQASPALERGPGTKILPRNRPHPLASPPGLHCQRLLSAQQGAYNLLFDRLFSMPSPIPAGGPSSRPLLGRRASSLKRLQARVPPAAASGGSLEEPLAERRAQLRQPWFQLPGSPSQGLFASTSRSLSEKPMFGG
ncbi:unnamed protein product, partial [Polarella glacialis]